MVRVALTGGVGSGKSAVAAMLRDLGAAVSQSDEVGRQLMQPGEAVFQAICDHFGPAVLASSGALDRAKLAGLAFEQGRLEELNAIVHPAVIAEQARWMNSVAAGDPHGLAVVESALVFETKYGAAAQLAAGGAAHIPWHARFDRIVVVTAPLDLRRSRYVQRVAAADASRAAVAGKDFDSRAAAQWSDEQKIALADTVIDNTGTLDQLRAATTQLYLELRQAASDTADEAM